MQIPKVSPVKSVQDKKANPLFQQKKSKTGGNEFKQILNSIQTK